MSEPIFFRAALQPSLADICAWTGAKAPSHVDLESCIVSRLAPIEEAGADTLVFFENPKYLEALRTTRAAACFVVPRFAAQVPETTIPLVTHEPYRAFALVLARIYPESLRPGSQFGAIGISPGASVHPEARLEADVSIDPGAVVGPRAEIGSGSVIGPNAVIGSEVRIGRHCSIGAGVTIAHALIGNRVIVHCGAAIGQDGFGFAPGPRGHLKVPQIGRVIIQDDVEIGANTTIDRGATRDTVIGEGTKIDNLVQIAHNVRIGRHCLIVAQVGISGSTEVGDFVSIGGQAGLAGHLSIGADAQIAAQAGVIADVPAKARLGGTPATSVRAWLKAHAVLHRLSQARGRLRRTQGR
jgi:UDP-3-O-[3-hydroxymyristoyl] glucosamine N-acyltransferase